MRHQPLRVDVEAYLRLGNSKLITEIRRCCQPCGWLDTDKFDYHQTITRRFPADC